MNQRRENGKILRDACALLAVRARSNGAYNFCLDHLKTGLGSTGVNNAFYGDSQKNQMIIHNALLDYLAQDQGSVLCTEVIKMLGNIQYVPRKTGSGRKAKVRDEK